MNYWVNSPLWKLSSNCYILLFIWQCLLLTDLHWNFQMLIIREEEVFWYSPCVNRALTCYRQALTVVAVAEQECQTYPGFWKITLMPWARMWLVAQLWVTDWAAAPRHTVIPSSPYNPSLNSALICASHRGDLSNSRLSQPFMQLGLQCCCSGSGTAELQLTPRHCIGSGKL